MAEEIIEVFFVRSEPPAVTPVQEPPRQPAATAGVRYQPTRPWSPAASTADAVKQNACRRQYLEGWADWRDRLPEYRACLAR